MFNKYGHDLGIYPETGDGHHRNVSVGELMALLLAERERYEGMLEIERAASDALKTEIRMLKNDSLTDSLTGVFNRKHFSDLQLSRNDFVTADRRCATGHWLLMVDLDGLKPINDNLGHNAGDEALITAARFLQKSVRETDIIVRMGGDEFVVLLRGVTEKDAALKIQKLYKGFETLSFEWEDKKIPVRASIGNAPFSPDKTLCAVLDEADQGMYETKRAKGAARGGPVAGLS